MREFISALELVRVGLATLDHPPNQQLLMVWFYTETQGAVDHVFILKKKILQGKAGLLEISQVLLLVLVKYDQVLGVSQKSHEELHWGAVPGPLLFFAFLDVFFHCSERLFAGVEKKQSQKRLVFRAVR